MNQWTICGHSVARGERNRFWYPAIAENQLVKKGDLLGYTEGFFGKCIREYHAEEDGTVFYYGGI